MSHTEAHGVGAQATTAGTMAGPPLCLRRHALIILFN